MIRPPPRSTRTDTLFPYRRSSDLDVQRMWSEEANKARTVAALAPLLQQYTKTTEVKAELSAKLVKDFAERQPGSANAKKEAADQLRTRQHIDRKSTRLNSSH